MKEKKYIIYALAIVFLHILSIMFVVFFHDSGCNFYTQIIAILSLLIFLNIHLGCLFYKHSCQVKNSLAQVSLSKDLFKSVVEMMQKDIADLDRTARERREMQYKLYYFHRMEMLSRLAGGLAHEFNNLLTPILLFCGIAKEGLSENKRLLKMLDSVSENCLRGKELINKIHFFADNAGNCNKTDICCYDFVADMIDCAKNKIPEITVIDNRVDNCNCILFLDKDMFFEAVENILDNAVNAVEDRYGKRDQGEFSICIERKRLFSDKPCDSGNSIVAGLYLAVEIKDNGIGIRKEEIGFIFDPLFTARDVGAGYGMGAAVSMAIIMEHEGYIEVDSEGENRGATFRIWLPLKEQLLKTGGKDEISAGN
ncbi:MAG: sensor histidine kinase [Gammaproteobacteria bacterium]|nr:MAG: sensor histidine kinase [Gammaproteobacteria bacterium]